MTLCFTTTMSTFLSSALFTKVNTILLESCDPFSQQYHNFVKQHTDLCDWLGVIDRGSIIISLSCVMIHKGTLRAINRLVIIKIYHFT